CRIIARLRDHLSDPPNKISRLFGERFNGFQSPFVTEIVCPVQRKQSVEQEIANPSHATRGVQDVTMLGEALSMHQGKFGKPQRIGDDFPAKFLGVAFYGRFEPGNYAIWIRQRYTVPGLCQVDDAAESEGRLLIVVMFIGAD